MGERRVCVFDKRELSVFARCVFREENGEDFFDFGNPRKVGNKMYFISTRGGEKVTGAQAIVQGLAQNGGLFVPEKFPKVSSEEMEQLAQLN